VVVSIFPLVIRERRVRWFVINVVVLGRGSGGLLGAMTRRFRRVLERAGHFLGFCTSSRRIALRLDRGGLRRRLGEPCWG
jgi:hypothetical protein